MSLLFVDGFDFYGDVSDLERKWVERNGGSYDSTTGRFGKGAFERNFSGARLETVYPQTSTVIVGFACKLTGSFDEGNMIEIRSLGNGQIGLRMNSDGTMILAAPSGATLGDPSTEALREDTWHYIEMKVVAGANDNGSAEVRVGGDTFINETGITTDPQNDGGFNDLRLGGGGGFPLFYDDVYILDTSGNQNNDFLGDVRISSLLPNADNTVTDWIPSSGNTNFEMVDEESFDTDTTFNSTRTVNDTDRFEATDLGVTPDEIFAVVESIAGKKTDADSRKHAGLIKTGSSVSTAAEDAFRTNYNYSQFIFENDPSGASWTKANVNGSQFGYTLTE